MMANSASCFWDNPSLVARVAYASKYVSDGFDIGSGNPVWQPSLELSLPAPGFTLMVWSSLQIDRVNRDFDEYDLLLWYKSRLFEGRLFQVSFHSYYDYWIFPGMNSIPAPLDQVLGFEAMKGNKLHAGVSLDRLISVADSYLVPTYNAYYWIYWAQNLASDYEGGAHHEFRIDYWHSLPLERFGVKAAWAGFGDSIHFNDGAFGVKPGLSHQLGGVSVGSSIGAFEATIRLNRQWSYNPTINPKDELWTEFSIQRSL